MKLASLSPHEVRANVTQHILATIRGELEQYQARIVANQLTSLGIVNVTNTSSRCSAASPMSRTQSAARQRLLPQRLAPAHGALDRICARLGCTCPVRQPQGRRIRSEGMGLYKPHQATHTHKHSPEGKPAAPVCNITQHTQPFNTFYLISANLP